MFDREFSSKAKPKEPKKSFRVYDTGSAKKKKSGEINPVLKDKYSDKPGTKELPRLSRATRMAMKSSKKADVHLTELYVNTIDDFKKKLYSDR